jgi:hypothetical protein
MQNKAKHSPTAPDTENRRPGFDVRPIGGIANLPNSFAAVTTYSQKNIQTADRLRDNKSWQPPAAAVPSEHAGCRGLRIILYYHAPSTTNWMVKIIKVEKTPKAWVKHIDRRSDFP